MHLPADLMYELYVENFRKFHDYKSTFALMITTGVITFHGGPGGHPKFVGDTQMTSVQQVN